MAKRHRHGARVDRSRARRARARRSLVRIADPSVGQGHPCAGDRLPRPRSRPADRAAVEAAGEPNMSDAPAAAPPSAQLVQMAMGHWVSRIVYLAAQLNLADQLADDARTSDELAAATGMHAPSLYRFMRSL